MTTKKFSAIKLPYPTYSLEFGSHDLKQEYLCLPRHVFDTKAHVIEVRETGYPKRVRHRSIGGSFISIREARPELFLRRDFLQKFVQQGVIHLMQGESSSYRMNTVNNVLIITLSEKQYRRFGLIAKKVKLDRATGKKYYQAEVDLNDQKIMSSNKCQDRLVRILRRLDSIQNLYLSFEPHLKTEDEDPNDECLRFCQEVIDEYALDGFEPVPLASCIKMEKSVLRAWNNYSQLHPEINLEDKTGEELVEIVDWLGYQLLSINCDEIYCKQVERFDVACKTVSGLFDQSNLSKYFRGADDEAVVFRAVILCNKKVALLQEPAKKSVIRVEMSAR